MKSANAILQLYSSMARDQNEDAQAVTKEKNMIVLFMRSLPCIKDYSPLAMLLHHPLQDAMKLQNCNVFTIFIRFIFASMRKLLCFA